MDKKTIIRSFAIISVVFALLSLNTPAVAQVRDSVEFVMSFKVNSSVVNVNYLNNRSVMDDFDAKWNELNSCPNFIVSDVKFIGNASSDGYYNRNGRLAQLRAGKTAEFIMDRYKIGLNLVSTGIDSWLNGQAGGKRPSRVEDRSCKIIIVYRVLPKVPLGPEGHIIMPVKDVAATPTPVAKVKEEPVAKVKEEPVVKPARKAAVDSSQTVRSAWRIKTNLLYDLATVANLSVEFGFCGHWAVEMLATFSPWDIRSDFKIRTLLLQPEVRYYLKKGYIGHYFGIEGHCGWYNVAFPWSHTRYQDRDGNTPLWGAGILYGYVLPFSKHWGMDFNIGIGYARLDYDCFYNVENGAKYTSSTKNWVGPTKLGVTIYYQF